MSTKEKKAPTTKIGQEKGISAGRPKGAKNKTTLFKEAMKEGFEAKLMKEGYAVFDAVVNKAKEGDMTAAKMILDRVVPVTKAIDVNALDSNSVKGITINIEKLVAETGNPEKVEIQDADYEEVLDE